MAMSIRKNDQVPGTTDSTRPFLPRAVGRAGHQPRGGRRREPDQAAHAPEPAKEHQGRDRRARSGNSCQQRDADRSRYQRADAHRQQEAGGRHARPHRPQERRSGGQMSKKQQTDAQIEEAKAAGKAAKAEKAEKAEKAAKKEAAEGKGSGPAVASHTKPSVIRLRDKYRADVIPALQKEFGYTNIMAVPKVTKVVVNMGLGEATSNAKVIDTGADELGKITGQKAAV